MLIPRGKTHNKYKLYFQRSIACKKYHIILFFKLFFRNYEKKYLEVERR